MTQETFLGQNAGAERDGSAPAGTSPSPGTHLTHLSLLTLLTHLTLLAGKGWPPRIARQAIPSASPRTFGLAGLRLLAFRLAAFRLAAFRLAAFRVLAVRVLALHLLVLPAFPGDRAHADVFTRPCALFGVEPALAMAISRVESGWHPYCVNVQGKDHYPDRLEDAAKLAREAMRKGRSVDVGLMQVNSFWLRKWGISPERALVPSVNVTLGLMVLAYEMKRHGPTWKAVGRYHSPDAARQARYVKKVARARESIVAAMTRGAGQGAQGPNSDPNPGPNHGPNPGLNPGLDDRLPTFATRGDRPETDRGDPRIRDTAKRP